MTSFEPALFARSHESVLWRTVGLLSGSGFFLPPIAAQDLVHDYLLEGAQGLLDHLRAEKQATAGLLAGHFYTYACQHAPRMEHAGRRLADLRSACLAPGVELPDMRAPQGTREATLVSHCFDSLAEEARLDLLTFVLRGHAGERMLAAQRGSTRLAVRAAIAETVARLTLALHMSAREHLVFAVAAQLWREGRSCESAAHHLGSARADVEAARRRFGVLLAMAIRLEPPRVQVKGELMLETDQQALKMALIHHDARSIQYLRDNAERIRECFDEEDDVALDEETMEALRSQPDALSSVYEAVFSAHLEPDAEAESEISQRIEALRADSTRELGEAFRAFVDMLPSDLVDWPTHFPRLGVDPVYREHLLRLPSVQIGGPKARALTAYGMVPETLSGVARSIQLMLEDQLHAVAGPPNWREDRTASNTSPALAPVSQEMLAANIAIGPYVPSAGEMPLHLAGWLLDVFGERPWFVPGYVSSAGGDGSQRVYRARAVHAHGSAQRPDLRALWTRGPSPQGATGPEL